MADYLGGSITAYNGHPLYEGRPVGAANDPVGTAADVVFNTGYDLIDTADGLGTMANAITARMVDAVPWTNHMPQSPIRPEDFGTAAKIGSAIVGNYQHSYVDPITQGRPLDIGKHFIAHPFNSLMDVNAVAQAAKIPTLIKGAVSKSAVVQDALDAANQIKNQQLAKVIPPETQAAVKGVQEINKSFKAAVNAEDMAFHNELGKAFQSIPKAMRGDVQAYAEGWHPALHAGQPVPPEIAQYLAKAETYSKVMRDRIQNYAPGADLALDKFQPALVKLRGLTTDAWQALPREKQLEMLAEMQAELASKKIEAQYSPHVSAIEAEATIGNPTKMPKIGIKNKLKSRSNRVILDGIKAQIAKLVAQRDEALAKGVTAAQLKPLNDKIAALDKELTDLLKDKAGFLMTKQTVGETAITSHYEALRTRWIQISQFHNAYNKILEQCLKLSEDLQTLKNAPDPAAKQVANMTVAELEKAGYTAISGEDLVQMILGPLEGAVLQEQELAAIVEKIVPGEVFMPKAMQSSLKAAMKQRTRAGGNWVVDTYDKLVTMSKRYMLGGKPTYGPAQGLQAMAMCDFVSMNGVRSTLAHVSAYYMATKSAVRNAVPLSIAENILENTVSRARHLENAVDWLFSPERPLTGKTPALIKAGIRAPISAFENYVDFNMRMGTVLDGFVRAKAGIAEAYMIASENTQLGQAVRDMFDSSKMIHALDGVYSDPAHLIKVSKKVNDALGNFKELADNNAIAAAGRIVPFPTWMAFITQYTAKLPINHPYKSLLLNNIAQLQQRYVANPNVPSYLKGAVSITGVGPNGQPQVVRKEGMNPITSVPEIYNLVSRFLTGQGDSSIVGAMTAPIQLGYIIATQQSPMTGKPFEDRSLVKGKSGKLYKKEDAERGLIDNGLAVEQHPRPDFLTLALRGLFPVQERYAESIAEKLYSNGARSQMSTMFHSSPKLNRATGGDKRAEDWISLFVHNLIDATPMEFDPNAKFLEEKQRHEDQKSATRQIMRMSQ